jgi:hypothetical protein
MKKVSIVASREATVNYYMIHSTWVCLKMLKNDINLEMLDEDILHKASFGWANPDLEDSLSGWKKSVWQKKRFDIPLFGYYRPDTNPVAARPFPVFDGLKKILESTIRKKNIVSS